MLGLWLRLRLKLDGKSSPFLTSIPTSTLALVHVIVKKRIIRSYLQFFTVPFAERITRNVGLGAWCFVFEHNVFSFESGLFLKRSQAFRAFHFQGDFLQLTDTFLG